MIFEFISISPKKGNMYINLKIEFGRNFIVKLKEMDYKFNTLDNFSMRNQKLRYAQTEKEKYVPGTIYFEVRIPSKKNRELYLIL